MTLEELKKQRDAHTTKIFWLGLQIIIIFGVPVAIGAIVGTKVDAAYDTGRKITAVLLAITFVFSWFLVIMKYRRLNKKLAEINEAIRKEK